MDITFLGLVAAGAAFGIARALTAAGRDTAHNRRLRTYFEGRDAAFKAGMLKGRQWLASYIAEAEHAADPRDMILRMKKHPARKSAEIVREVKAEKRDLTAKLKFLEFQLKSYEEYFPDLVEYRDMILDETIPLAAGANNSEELEAADPTAKYLSSEEWKALPASAKNQLALDRYLNRPKSNWEIGRLYERYLGYLREAAGWVVTNHGAKNGFEDLGRDLICERGGVVEIVQAKCWSAARVIHEKYVFQLYGTTLLYRLQHPGVSVTPVLATTTSLSGVAQHAARELGVRVEAVPLPATYYPMIKCNISSGGERIYHLPIDQQYDKVLLVKPGECYVATVREAEKLGFRRAWRYRGPGQAGAAA
jgi:hypothetical protein